MGRLPAFTLCPSERLLLQGLKTTQHMVFLAFSVFRNMTAQTGLRIWGKNDGF
jgi:hypothetical protein